MAVIGGAYGIGVLVDLSTGERTYLNINRLDLGAGLSIQKYRGVMLASGEEELEAWRHGGSYRYVWADVAVGTSASSSEFRRSEHRAYIVSDSGATLSATARMVKLSVNQDLTDTGLSEFSIPNIGMGMKDGLEPAQERTWDNKLPFMAQKVIDMGYDLPLPYGLNRGYLVKLAKTRILEINVIACGNGSRLTWSGCRNPPNLLQITWF